MNITFINNRIRTQSGVFYAHMLPLMQFCAAKGHIVNFLNFHPGTLTAETRATVNGWSAHWCPRNWVPVARHLMQTDLVYCRNYGCAVMALVMRRLIGGKFRVHADLRGAVPEEVRNYKQSPFRAFLVFLSRCAQRLILWDSDSISCVSHPFRNYLLTHGGKPEKITVVPNGVDIDRYSLDPDIRAAIRAQLGLDGQLVYVFCGSPSSWIRLREMLQLYKKIQNARENTRLLIITGKTVVFEKLLKETGITDALLFHLKSPQVPPYLMAGDYAFLMRGNDIVTHVSAPIKFAEYLAAGNKIIITADIGDSSQLVVENDAGMIVEPSQLDQIVPLVTAPVPIDEKIRISQLASEHLDRQKIIDASLRSLGI